MYCVFVRDYRPEGTFEAVRRDLDRIRAIGTDIIWLMPVHPVGRDHRKGSAGSPYAIADFREIDPEYGSMEDFVRLVNDIHAKGMKCMIDVVYHHTSPDSWLAQHHPEWFYHKQDGSFGNRIGDWWDVIDLDYAHEGLWEYLMETLQMWAQYVDGFRCDVAPLVPLEFWKRARERVNRDHPGCLWLAESGEPQFIAWCRHQGIYAASDSELYEAFDICYDYDIFGTWNDALQGRIPMSAYAKALNMQECIYPENYCKLHFLENHDRVRAAQTLQNDRVLYVWTAVYCTLKGMNLIYAGEEKGVRHQPSLFDPDPVDWNAPDNTDLTDLYARMHQIRQDPVFTDSTCTVTALSQNTLAVVHTQNADRTGSGADEHILAGIFNVSGQPVSVSQKAMQKPLPDGAYPDLLTGKEVRIRNGVIHADTAAAILRIR